MRSTETRRGRQPVPITDPLLRMPAIAEHLDVSTPRAYAIVHEHMSGSIVRYGRAIRVPESAVRAFIAAGGSTSTAPAERAAESVAS